MNQSRTRATDNTSLLLTASNPYTKMAAPGWPGSCNIRIKVTLVELAIPFPPPQKNYYNNLDPRIILPQKKKSTLRHLLKIFRKRKTSKARVKRPKEEVV